MAVTTFTNDFGNLETDFSAVSGRYFYVIDNNGVHFVIDAEERIRWRLGGAGPQKYAAILYGNEDGTGPRYVDVYLSNWEEPGTVVYDLFGGPGEMERVILGEREDPLTGEFFQIPSHMQHLLSATETGQSVWWYLGEEQDMKRVLASLQADTRYAIRVRAYNNLGVYSDWSEALDFKTPTDQTVPNPPTGLEIDFNTPDMILRWMAPTHNTDGTELRDLARYYIKLTVGGTSREYETGDTFFSYSYAQNVRDFGTASPQFDIEIRAVDVHNKMSSPLTAEAINEPPQQPLALSGFGGFQSVTIYMNPHPEDEDIRFYILERAPYDEVEEVIGEFEHLVTTRNDSHTDILGEDDSIYYYRYKVRDVFGQESVYSEVSSDFSATSSLALTQLSDVTDPAGSAGDVLTKLENGEYAIQPLDVAGGDHDHDDDYAAINHEHDNGGGGGNGDNVKVYWARRGNEDSTSSSSYTTLNGPSVEVDVPAGGWIHVVLDGEHYDTSARARMSVRLTGANTISASNDWCALWRNANHDGRSASAAFENLEGGLTTVEAMYRTDGSSRFLNRRITVLVGS